jgi:hypothetical protein
MYTVLFTYQTNLVIELAESRIAKATLVTSLWRVLLSDIVDKVERLQHSIDDLGSRN